MKKIILLSVLLIVGCDVFKKDVRGCTDESACKFKVNANKFDNSCDYEFDVCEAF